MAVGSECLFAGFALENGRVTQGYAKPKLFEPNRNGELSIFDVVGLSCEERCKLGIPVAKTQNKRLYGWGVVSCEQIREVGLVIERDNTPRDMPIYSARLAECSGRSEVETTRVGQTGQCRKAVIACNGMHGLCSV